MEAKIFEDGAKQYGYTDETYNALLQATTSIVGEERAKRGHYYLTKYHQRQGEVNNMLGEWESLNRLMKCERDDVEGDEHAPRSFIPVLLPIIAGQAASVCEPNQQIAIIGAHPGDKEYVPMLEAGSGYMRDRDNFKQMLKDSYWDYATYGNVVLYMWWDEDDNFGRGSGKVDIVPLSNFFWDGKIKDVRDFQRGEYGIHEVGFKSIQWARKEYGDDIANAIISLNSEYHFDGAFAHDDIESFALLRVWTRNNEKGNLQLIEMDKRGLILRESDPSKPFYKFTDNKYPFAFARLYKVPFNMYGYGDGRLLEPIQRTINRLMDEIEIACRFNAQPRTFLDPASKIDEEEMTTDPSKPVWATNPNQTVRVVEGRGISDVIMQNLNFLLDQAQKVTRFSELMMGVSSSVSATATQVGMQGQQGNVGIADKRSDLAKAVEFAEWYRLGLALEFWDEQFWVHLNGGEYESVDFTQMQNVPRMVPSDINDKLDWSERNNKDIGESPKWTTAEWDEDSDDMDEDGAPVYRKGDTIMRPVQYDAQVKLGEGMPTSKIAMYNIILSLAQLQVMDENTGMPAPLLYRSQVKQMIETILGMDLGTGEEEMKRMIPQLMQQALGGVNPVSGDSVGMPMGSKSSMPPTNLDSTVAGASMVGGRING